MCYECNFTPDFVWILKKPCRNLMYLRRIFEVRELEKGKNYVWEIFLVYFPQHCYLLTYLLTYLITYLLSSCSRVLLENLTSSQLVKKSPAFYGTQRFITTFTNACPLFICWARSIQSMPPHPTSWRSILILSTHLCLLLQSGLSPSGFPTKSLYTLLFSPILATAPPISFF